jgi:hypothetical protein
MHQQMLLNNNHIYLENWSLVMSKIICNKVSSLFSFIREMKHLSISQWEVEQKEVSAHYQVLPQQKVTK